MKKALTLTIVANMTSNYSEGIGNIASVQKVFKNRKVYSMRSRESLKNAIMVQSGMYDDLETSKDGAAQKKVNEELNAANCRALVQQPEYLYRTRSRLLPFPVQQPE